MPSEIVHPIVSGWFRIRNGRYHYWREGENLCVCRKYIRIQQVADFGPPPNEKNKCWPCVWHYARGGMPDA